VTIAGRFRRSLLGGGRGQRRAITRGCCYSLRSLPYSGGRRLLPPTFALVGRRGALFLFPGCGWYVVCIFWNLLLNGRTMPMVTPSPQAVSVWRGLCGGFGGGSPFIYPRLFSLHFCRVHLILLLSPCAYCRAAAPQHKPLAFYPATASYLLPAPPFGACRLLGSLNLPGRVLPLILPFAACQHSLPLYAWNAFSIPSSTGSLRRTHLSPRRGGWANRGRPLGRFRQVDDRRDPARCWTEAAERGIA